MLERLLFFSLAVTLAGRRRRAQFSSREGCLAARLWRRTLQAPSRTMTAGFVSAASGFATGRRATAMAGMLTTRAPTRTCPFG